MMTLSATTEDLARLLPQVPVWRRADLITWMSFTSGSVPSPQWLAKFALHGESVDERSAGIFTLFRRHGASSADVFREALADRSFDVSLVAAAALAEVGTANDVSAFLEWAKRCFSRRSRLRNVDLHEIPVALKFATRNGVLDEMARILRRNRRNLSMGGPSDNDETLMLARFAPLVLDESHAALTSNDIDLDDIEHWGDVSGQILDDLDERVAVNYEKRIAELLAAYPRG